MASNTRETGNWLLDLLPRDELKLLLDSSTSVLLQQGQEVYGQDGAVSHAYFPTTSVFSVVIRMENGAYVEGMTIGKEGMLGLPIYLNQPDSHPFTVVTQLTGEALRMPATRFLQALNTGIALDRLLRRYVLFRLRCATQIGACNVLHSVEERTCRWLLMAHDRAGADRFFLTHETLSELLGVRRQTISIVAGALQRAGLVTYRRGLLRVLDRDGLEASSCECYGVLREMYERIVAVRSKH